MAQDYSGSGQYHYHDVMPVTDVPVTLAAWSNPDALDSNYAILTTTRDSSMRMAFGLRWSATVLEMGTFTGAGYTPAQKSGGSTASTRIVLIPRSLRK